MRKRTNLKKKRIGFLITWLIPLIVLVAICTSFENPLEKLVELSLYVVNHKEVIEGLKVENSNASTLNDTHTENVESNSIIFGNSNENVLTIPDDVKQLVEKAKVKYANSTRSGNIVSVDYNKHNATDEFDGIYIRNTTLSHTVDIEEYLNKLVPASINKNKPSVLVYHTHTSESYELLDRDFYTETRDTRSDNSAENMVRVGEEICKVLETNGYKTIHVKKIFDNKLNGAYDRSRKEISQILKDNPSIQIVLDVHRDSIYQKDGSRIKTITEINGLKVAQIMIVSGCEDGNVTNFPNWKKNLTFAIKLQKQLKDDNPTLVRPLMFCSRKYNMDLTPCALSIEIGTDANTLSEAVLSANLFAQSLSEFLEEY